jgi:hypothetical protein
VLLLTSTAYKAGELTGLVMALVVAGFFLRRALTRGFGGRPGRGRNAVVAVVAVLAAAAYLASAAGGMFGSSSSASASLPSAWLGLEGEAMKAGFVSGCGRGDRGRTATCECVFSRLVATPRYSTPTRFGSLALEISKERNGGPIPAELVTAADACRRAKS